MSQSNLQTGRVRFEHIPFLEQDPCYETLHGKIVPIAPSTHRKPGYLEAPKTLFILTKGGDDFTVETCIATPTTLNAAIQPGDHQKNWQTITIGGLVPFARYKFMTTARILEEFYFEGNHLGIGVINFPMHEELVLTVWKRN